MATASGSSARVHAGSGQLQGIEKDIDSGNGHGVTREIGAVVKRGGSGIL